MTAAAESLQSCPTLCNPIDGSPSGFPVPGILQARTLEWLAISFSNAWKWKVKAKSLSRVRLLATPWTAAFQAPPSMGFSRQEHWSGVPLAMTRIPLRITREFRSFYHMTPLPWSLFLQAMHMRVSQMVLVVKPANPGALRDMGSIPWSGRSPGGVHGNPLLHSCVENPVDRGDWPATVHGVAWSWTRLEQLSTQHTCIWRRQTRIKTEGGDLSGDSNDGIWKLWATHLSPVLVVPARCKRTGQHSVFVCLRRK